jgi:hypothetical protein
MGKIKAKNREMKVQIANGGVMNGEKENMSMNSGSTKQSTAKKGVKNNSNSSRY